MTNVVARDSFTIEVPSTWAVRDEPDCLTLSRSNDGAFQLSSARRSNGAIDHDELRRFYEPTVPANGRFEPYATRTFSGFVATWEAEEVLWRKYWLACGQILVFATYIGSESAWSRDNLDVERMLDTLKAATGACGNAT
jgi:hypothetical protein